MPVRFVIRESHLLKSQASALSDAIAAAAAAAATANEVACYNLVQFAQSWLEQMQLAATAPQSGSAAKPAAASAAPAPETAAAYAAAADACASLVGSGGSANSSVAILMDLWRQGQDIHSQ